jgi:hypothetical protein
MSVIATALAVIASGLPARPVVRDPFPRHQRPRAAPPMQPALASWYALDGPGACGYGAQGGLRFASLFLRCGTRIRICRRRCVTATMSDHGPYVANRLFDLNRNLRDAIGCLDLCWVKWRLA